MHDPSDCAPPRTKYEVANLHINGPPSPVGVHRYDGL